MMGMATKPLELRVDKSSVRVRVKERIRVHSSKSGWYTMQLFNLSFKVQGVIEYIGQLSYDARDEENERIKKAAGLEENWQ